MAAISFMSRSLERSNLRHETESRDSGAASLRRESGL
jgi:hypothetical protein